MEFLDVELDEWSCRICGFHRVVSSTVLKNPNCYDDMTLNESYPSFQRRRIYTYKKLLADSLFTGHEVNARPERRCVLAAAMMQRMIRLRQMLLPRLDGGDEGCMETSPRFTRGGFSTKIQV
ncbi:unnamed protein product [Eruca vesicaria subsp. sativa]|uniref:Uncharacterized protein n=1 Tax=Eruca vesicaria subsp. sativa TaxID=29727 RepID=A0ABC8KYY6_ERUVS|nr:unnamed protein product [Eruca vesicaria subsp. sativa]